MRTVPAVKQAIGDALTNPPLTYTVNDAAPLTLPTDNVFGAAPVDIVDPPDPMVSFIVGARPSISPELRARELEIKLSISSGKPNGDDIVDELYEAVRARLLSTDGGGRNALSRSATATTLPVSIVTIREAGALPPGYDSQSSRWYLTATLVCIAT